VRGWGEGRAGGGGHCGRVADRWRVRVGEREEGRLGGGGGGVVLVSHVLYNILVSKAPPLSNWC